jgi:hypothetical protein
MVDLKWRIEPRENGKAHFLIACEHGVDHGGAEPECARSVWRGPPAAESGVAVMWQWDGDLTAPSISPSIDCKGGCGRHFTMVGGIPR